MKCVIVAKVTSVRSLSQCRITYCCCSNCACRVFYDDTGWTCLRCNASKVKTECRYRITLTVVDDHHSTNVTVFGHTIESLVGCSAAEFENHIAKLSKCTRNWEFVVTSAINDTFVGRQFLFGIVSTRLYLGNDFSLSTLLHNSVDSKATRCCLLATQHRDLVASQMFLSSVDVDSFSTVICRIELLLNGTKCPVWNSCSSNDDVIELNPLIPGTGSELCAVQDTDVADQNDKHLGSSNSGSSAVQDTPTLLTCDRVGHMTDSSLCNICCSLCSVSTSNHTHNGLQYNGEQGVGDDGDDGAVVRQLSLGCTGNADLSWTMYDVNDFDCSGVDHGELPYSEDIEAFLQDLKQCRLQPTDTDNCLQTETESEILTLAAGSVCCSIQTKSESPTLMEMTKSDNDVANVQCCDAFSSVTCDDISSQQLVCLQASHSSADLFNNSVFVVSDSLSDVNCMKHDLMPCDVKLLVDKLSLSVNDLFSSPEQPLLTALMLSAGAVTPIDTNTSKDAVNLSAELFSNTKLQTEHRVRLTSRSRRRWSRADNTPEIVKPVFSDISAAAAASDRNCNWLNDSAELFDASPSVEQSLYRPQTAAAILRNSLLFSTPISCHIQSVTVPSSALQHATPHEAATSSTQQSHYLSYNSLLSPVLFDD